MTVHSVGSDAWGERTRVQDSRNSPGYFFVRYQGDVALDAKGKRICGRLICGCEWRLTDIA